jgi:hypothetical protein
MEFLCCWYNPCRERVTIGKEMRWSGRYMSIIRGVTFKVAIALTFYESHGGCMVAIPRQRKQPPKPVWTDTVSFNKFKGVQKCIFKV